MTNTTSDMFIDTDSFDFLSLNDVKTESYPTTDKPFDRTHTMIAESKNIDYPDSIIEQPETREEFSLFDETEEEEKQFDPKGIDDLKNLSHEELQGMNEEFHSLSDDAVIDLGEYQFTKEQVIELVTNQNKINEEKAFFDQVSKGNHEQMYKWIMDQATAFKTEREITLNALHTELNRPGLTREEKMDLRDAIDAENLKMDILKQKLIPIYKAREQQEAQLFDYRRQFTRNAMINEYGKGVWSDKNAGDVFQYAINNGIQERMITDYLDPSLAKIFMKARAYDNEMSKRKTQALKEVKQPWARSNSSSQVKSKESVSSQQKALRYKMNNGGLEANEVSAMFNQLIN